MMTPGVDYNYVHIYHSWHGQPEHFIYKNCKWIEDKNVWSYEYCYNDKELLNSPTKNIVMIGSPLQKLGESITELEAIQIILTNKEMMV